VIKRDHAPVVENDGSVLSGDGLSPPLVVDAPTLAHDLDSPSRLSGQSHVDGLTVLVGAYSHGARLRQ